MRRTKKITDDAARKEIFSYAFKLADEHNYLAKDKNTNGLFMDQLAANPNVGGRLADFIGKAEIHKYIKDTILNQYSKVKRRLPKDVRKILSTKYSCDIHDVSYVKKDFLSVHRAEKKILVVVRTNYLKWETAIRKLALYVAGTITDKSLDVDMIAIIFEQGVPVNQGDRELVTSALNLLGIQTIWE